MTSSPSRHAPEAPRAHSPTGSDLVPSHPLISDALARALLRAFMDAELIGIALLRGPDHTHVMLNARYQSLAEGTAALGEPVRNAWPDRCAPPELLDEVLRTGEAQTIREVASKRATRPWAPPAHVTLTYMRVEDDDGGALLVLVEDVSERVLAKKRAALLQSLVDDLVGCGDAHAAVSRVAQRTRDALGATDTSLFLVDEKGLELHGAPGTWDWTRTSFTTSLADWPSVAEALSHGEPFHMTLDTARGAEAGWFEARGVASTLCVPLSHEARPLGVLFFDFGVGHTPLEATSAAFVTDVAKRCAVALSQALAQRPSRAPAGP